jgi:ribonuclease D
MTCIVDTGELAAFCRRLSQHEFISIDTEFMRETTYWPRLCLVQVAGADEARAIDPLAPGIDLKPLFELLASPTILKVFHAARQDLEIFFHLMGQVPAPLFDSQVAAMVCGFGEQVGYETLTKELVGASVDKSSRFTDWSKRPLTDRQLAYALSDVTHLRVIYAKLKTRLARSGRSVWLGEEMAVLANPVTYDMHPERAWQRIRTRSTAPRFLGVLKEVAAWREVEAQTRDVPRARIIRDESMLEIAGEPPRTVEDLARVRGLGRGLAEGRGGQALLAAVARALALPPGDLPQVEREQVLPKGIGPLVELLKVMLRIKCDEHDVAAKLIASVADLERIAADDEADVPALHGWRREIFGDAALALKSGRIGMAASGRRIRLIPLAGPAASAPAEPLGGQFSSQAVHSDRS